MIDPDSRPGNPTFSGRGGRGAPGQVKGQYNGRQAEQEANRCAAKADHTGKRPDDPQFAVERIRPHQDDVDPEALKTAKRSACMVLMRHSRMGVRRSNLWLSVNWTGKGRFPE